MHAEDIIAIYTQRSNTGCSSTLAAYSVHRSLTDDTLFRFHSARIWMENQVANTGVIVARQRPPTARGTAFLALEDKGGLINVVLRPEVVEAYHSALGSPFVVVEGKLQWRGQAISVLGRRVVAVEVGRE